MTGALVPAPAEVARAQFATIAAARRAEQDALHDETDPWLRADTEMEIWLRNPKYGDGTRDQYRRVYQSWRTWLIMVNVPPFSALRSDVEAYALALSKVGNPAAPSPKPMSNRSIARHLSAMSSFYDRAISDQCTDRNPVPPKDRPKVDSESRQPHLMPDELRALIATADADGPVSSALVALLVLACLRVTEALRARIEDMTYENGTHLLRVTRKGGKVQRIPLPDQVWRRIVPATQGRREGPILLSPRRMSLDRKTAWEMIRRLGQQAGIVAAIGPHTLRHAYITRGHELGIPVDRLQVAAGHASVDTTRGYDRSHLDRANHPSFAIAADLDPDEAAAEPIEVGEGWTG